VVHKEKEGPAIVELRWMHATHEQPAQALVTLDGKQLVIDKTFRATLPKLDPSKPHLIEAQLRFSSGVVARHEITIAGDAYSDAVESELAPVVVRRAPDAQNLGGCFTSDGHAVRVAAVEKGKPLVVMVKDPDSADARFNLGRENGPSPRWTETDVTKRFARVNARQRILWPVMQEYDRPDNPTMDVFPSSLDIDGREYGMLWMITRRERGGIAPHEPRFFSDADAVAGMMAAKDGTPRAVVLLLTKDYADESLRDAAVTRRYLRSLGVPLHVWMFGAPTANETAAWVEVEDISTNDKLNVATQRLRKDLADQTVVWLATDAVHALRSSVKDGCTAELVASDH
jgi:hypothetical protein